MKTFSSHILTKDGAPHTLLIDDTPHFNAVCVQISGSGGGDSIALEGKLAGAAFFPVGTLANGTFGTLAADGLLFYRGYVPLTLQLNYTIGVVVGDVTAFIMRVKDPRAKPLDY